MSRLASTTALVTGASSGLGLAIARSLGAEGAAVIAGARRFAPARPTPSAGSVTEVRLDVTDEKQVVALFEQAPPIDVLVNCAGTGTFAPVCDASVEDLRQMLEVHVVGAFLCAREALRRMRQRMRGHIVNVSSIAAFRAFTSCGGYTAAKEGLRGLTRVLVEEARAHDVRVTGLYPGAIDTPIWDSREGFDRADMMNPDRIAELVVEIVARPELSVEELLVLPPKGAL